MRLLVVLVVVLTALGACVSDNRPETCADTVVTIELAISADGMAPNDPGACRDQRVTLVIDSTVSGQFHIHGYDEALPITEVRAGETARAEFVADRSGQFPVELHPTDDPGGVEIGVFTVYEP